MRRAQGVSMPCGVGIFLARQIYTRMPCRITFLRYFLILLYMYGCFFVMCVLHFMGYVWDELPCTGQVAHAVGRKSCGTPCTRCARGAGGGLHGRPYGRKPCVWPCCGHMVPRFGEFPRHFPKNLRQILNIPRRFLLKWPMPRPIPQKRTAKCHGSRLFSYLCRQNPRECPASPLIYNIIYIDDNMTWRMAGVPAYPRFCE